MDIPGIDQMEPEIRNLCNEIAVEIQCGLNHDHRFYLPFRLIENVETVHCPICDKYFPFSDGEYDQYLATVFHARLTGLLQLLPPDTKYKIRKMVKEWNL